VRPSEAYRGVLANYGMKGPSRWDVSSSENLMTERLGESGESGRERATPKVGSGINSEQRNRDGRDSERPERGEVEIAAGHRACHNKKNQGLPQKKGARQTTPKKKKKKASVGLRERIQEKRTQRTSRF